MFFFWCVYARPQYQYRVHVWSTQCEDFHDGGVQTLKAIGLSWNATSSLVKREKEKCGWAWRVRSACAAPNVGGEVSGFHGMCPSLFSHYVDWRAARMVNWQGQWPMRFLIWLYERECGSGLGNFLAYINCIRLSTLPVPCHTHTRAPTLLLFSIWPGTHLWFSCSASSSFNGLCLFLILPCLPRLLFLSHPSFLFTTILTDLLWSLQY